MDKQNICASTKCYICLTAVALYFSVQCCSISIYYRKRNCRRRRRHRNNTQFSENCGCTNNLFIVWLATIIKPTLQCKLNSSLLNPKPNNIQKGKTTIGRFCTQYKSKLTFSAWTKTNFCRCCLVHRDWITSTFCMRFLMYFISTSVMDFWLSRVWVLHLKCLWFNPREMESMFNYECNE